MGKALSWSKSCSGGRSLNLVEGALDKACFGGAIVVGIDHISSEGIILRTPLAVHIIYVSLWNSVLEDIEHTGGAIVAAAYILGAACGKADL